MWYPKILLVDDNDDLLLITQIILKGQGYEVILARTIEEAEHKIKLHHPPLILLDIFICEQDGREFCRQLKQEAGTKDIRVILMSGDDDHLRKAKVGDDVLPKPFNYDELVEKVRVQMLSAPASLSIAG